MFHEGIRDLGSIQLFPLLFPGYHLCYMVQEGCQNTSYHISFQEKGEEGILTCPFSFPLVWVYVV